MGIYKFYLKAYEQLGIEPQYDEDGEYIGPEPVDYELKELQYRMIHQLQPNQNHYERMDQRPRCNKEWYSSRKLQLYHTTPLCRYWWWLMREGDSAMYPLWLSPLDVELCSWLASVRSAAPFNKRTGYKQQVIDCISCLSYLNLYINEPLCLGWLQSCRNWLEIEKQLYSSPAETFKKLQLEDTAIAKALKFVTAKHPILNELLEMAQAEQSLRQGRRANHQD